jgi:hypothetical protein
MLGRGPVRLKLSTPRENDGGRGLNIVLRFSIPTELPDDEALQHLDVEQVIDPVQLTVELQIQSA